MANAFDQFDEHNAFNQFDAPVRRPITAADRVGAVGAGANRGIAGLLGLPVDTAANLVDLGKAATGGIRSWFTDKPVPSWLELQDRSTIPLSGEWISKQMNKSPVTTTQMSRPDDTASRYLYAGGAALPGVMMAQPSTMGQAAAATTQNVFPALAAQGTAEVTRGTQYENSAPILASLLTQAAPSAVSYAAKAFTPKPDESTAAAAKTLEDAGVRLDAAQKTGSEGLKNIKRLATDNPFTGPAQIKNAQKQSQQYTRAVLKTIGEDASAATPEVLARASERIGSTIGDISERTPVTYNTAMHSEIGNVLDEASRILPPEELAIIKGQVDFLNRNINNGSGFSIDTLTNTPKGNPTIDGKTMQTLRSELGLISKDGGRLGHVAGNLQSVIDDAIQQNAKGNDYANLKQARQQYRALKQIIPAIDKMGDGTISPARLANSLPAGNAGKNQFFYGRGDQTLVNLAKAGNKLLPDKAPNSGTAARSMLQYLPAAAVASGASMLGGNPIPALALGLGAYTLPKIAQKVLNSPTALTGQQQISDPRMLQYATQTGLLANQGL